jgi:hypothetical protein
MAYVSALLTLALALSGGQTAGQRGGATAERRQAILEYQLTMPRANELIAAVDEMTKYVVSLPDYRERIRKSMTMTPGELQAQIENDPKAVAILKQNNLTANDYLVGVPALRMALMVAEGLPPNEMIVASPANVSFVRAHMAELKPKIEAAEGLGGRR